MQRLGAFTTLALPLGLFAQTADLSTLRIVVTALRGNLLYDASQAGVHRAPLTEWAASIYAVRVMAGHQMDTAVWAR